MGSKIQGGSRLFRSWFLVLTPTVVHPLLLINPRLSNLSISIDSTHLNPWRVPFLESFGLSKIYQRHKYKSKSNGLGDPIGDTESPETHVHVDQEQGTPPSGTQTGVSQIG